MRPKAKKPKRYWYKYTEYECVLCCRMTIYKERVYDKPKPKNYDERHDHR